jgi:hypothetical protein
MLLKNRSVQAALLLTLYFLTASSLPLDFHRGLYTISLFLKDLLLWLLPLTVGFFIAHAVSSFEKKAPLFILTLLLFEALSNGASVWYAYGCGHIAATHIPPIIPHPFNDAFAPLWRLPFTKPLWWSADKGTIVGVILGLAAAIEPHLKVFIHAGKQGAEWVLTRCFSRLIPLFILGFVARMVQTHLLDQMFTHYAEHFLWLVFFLALYAILLFAIGSGRGLFQALKNLLPATGIAFSSGCSLSTMPWTIEGASKNLDNPDLAKAIIPATTNIQQVGDCIANAFLCFLIYRHFHGHNPSLGVWIPFSCLFVLARFATAAVLGGAIFIMIPLYETYLGFTPEMIAIILAFNVLLDPLITCSNVIGNGALCRIFEKTWGFVTRRLDPGHIV